MDYKRFEPDYPPRMFKDRRKRKCNGVKGKPHRWDTTAGNDCHWYSYTYPWVSDGDKIFWSYACECWAVCKDCGTRNDRRNRYQGRLCLHKDWRAFTKPEGVK